MEQAELLYELDDRPGVVQSLLENMFGSAIITAGVTAIAPVLFLPETRHAEKPDAIDE